MSGLVIAVDGPDGPLSGWKMRNARLPARVREEHSETAYTTDRAIDFLRAQGDDPWVLHLSYVKPHWPYIAPSPYHAMYGPEHCLPVKRHAEERGPSAHPMFRAWQDEEVSQSFQREEASAIVRPTYQGLIAQVDDHLGRVWETPPEDQGDQPTLGLWVSCKGDKAYAYDLVDVSEG